MENYFPSFPGIFFLSPMQGVVFKFTVLYLRLIQIKVLSISMIVFQICQQEYQSLPSKQSKPPGAMQLSPPFLSELYFARDAFLEIHFCVILQCIQKFLALVLPESRLGPCKGLKVCIKKTSKYIWGKYFWSRLKKKWKRWLIGT